MSTSNVQQGIITQRRRRVAGLRLRGLALDEIALALAHPVYEGGLRNPTTGEPWSRATIARDLATLQDEWREAASEEIATFQAMQLAELREARRLAWQSQDTSEIRRNLETEMRLLGSDAPRNVNVGLTLSKAALRALSILEQNGLPRDAILGDVEDVLLAMAAEAEAGVGGDE